MNSPLPKVIIPKESPEEKKRGCPKCGHDSWTGRNIGGVITSTCSKCGNKWYGGLPQVAADPRRPIEPMDPRDKPTLGFRKNSKTGELIEEPNPPSLVPDFRRGVPIRDLGEDDV